MALVGGAATLLAAAPLATVYASYTWLFFTAVAVAVIVGTAMLVRSMRGPVWAQVLAMMGALLLFATFAFPSGDEILRLIPTPGTFRHFNSLLVDAGAQIRDQAVPVPDHDGLLLLTTVGVGLVAVLVDFSAVGLRRPALAGLPMLAIYSVPVAVLPGSLSVLPFGLAGIGFLWLLVADSVDRVRRFGRRFTGEGRDVDLWEPSPLSAAGRRLGAVGLAVAVLLPLALPGMTSGLIDRFGTGGLGPAGGGGPGAGGAAAVNLTALLSDNLTRSEEFEMVRVRTTDPTPYYLRFGVAEEATPEGFVSRSPSSGTSVSRGLPEWGPPDVGGVTARQFRAEVEIVNLDMRLVPVYQQVVKTEELSSSWFYDPASNQIFSRRENINGRSYAFDFVRLTYTAAALRSAGTIPATDAYSRDLTSLPISTDVSNIVAGLIEGKTSQYDRVKAIYDYFDTEGFGYSLSTAPGGTGNPIEDFLANKRGFCVQYAAAMAWMVRAAGYPARVAFGFTRGSGSSAGVYSLTNYNLHAWTEVYFQDIGWVPFDATPSSSVEGSVPSTWVNDPISPINPEENPEPLPGPSGSAAPGLPGRPEPGDEGQGAVPDAPSGGINVWYVVAGAAVLLVLLVIIAPALRRQTLRRRRQARSADVIVLGDTSRAAAREAELVLDPAAVEIARRDAHLAWEEMLDTMIDYGVAVDASETPRATAVRLGGLVGIDPAARAPSGLLARAEERARYAREPLRPHRLNEAVRVVREALNERASRLDRIRALLLPRSVLMRWRSVWTGWMSNASIAAARVRNVTVSLSPRRLLTRGAR
jgi:transglutaminase-like putative cysteine protease